MSPHPGPPHQLIIKINHARNDPKQSPVEIEGRRSFACHSVDSILLLNIIYEHAIWSHEIPLTFFQSYPFLIHFPLFLYEMGSSICRPESPLRSFLASWWHATFDICIFIAHLLKMVLLSSAYHHHSKDRTDQYYSASDVVSIGKYPFCVTMDTQTLELHFIDCPLFERLFQAQFKS